MPALFVTTDLMFSSRVSGAAQAAGFRLDVVATADEAINRATATDAHLLILDLRCPGIDVADLVTRLKQTANPPAVVAYGPHVQEELLHSAQAAGCDEVMPRSQFNAQIASILGKYLSPQNGERAT